MSEYHELFIHTNEHTDRFLADLEAACGHPVKKFESGPWKYAARTNHGALEVERDPDYDDDMEMPLSAFETVVSIRDFDRDRKRQEKEARRIFNELKNTGRYSILLTLEAQRLLDAWPPLEGRALDQGYV